MKNSEGVIRLATAKRPGPLEGIKVVELGTHVAVPNSGRIMADCGADVIKVEGLKGEEWRILGKTYKIPANDEENAVFTSQNSNKKFIGLNLKSEEGLEVMHKLLAEADVFISNVRLKSLKKMGLDYDSLKEKFPKLICAHFTGFGYDGPDSARPGFDMAAFWARSGVMADFSDRDSFPMKPISGFGDATSSNTLLSGIMMALFSRERTGKGTMVSTSLYGNGIWFASCGVIVTQEPYNCEYPKSGKEPLNPLAHIYRCKDGEWIIVTIVDYNGLYEKLFKLLGLDDYINDERFNNRDSMQKNVVELTVLVQERMLTKDRAEWVKIFEEADVVHECLTHMRDISTDPQAWENNYLEKVKFKTGTEIAMARVPLMFSDFDLKEITTSAGVGCDSVEILQSLGYSADQIKAMEEAKAIRCTER